MPNKIKMFFSKEEENRKGKTIQLWDSKTVREAEASFYFH